MLFFVQVVTEFEPESIYVERYTTSLRTCGTLCQHFVRVLFALLFGSHKCTEVIYNSGLGDIVGVLCLFGTVQACDCVASYRTKLRVVYELPIEPLIAIVDDVCYPGSFSTHQHQ